MDELIGLLSGWTIYAVIFAGVIVWYASSLIFSQIIDASTGDAAKASSAGIFIGLVIAVAASSLTEYLWFESITGAIAAACGTLLVSLCIIAASSKANGAQ